jgi:hypothetical protein
MQQQEANNTRVVKDAASLKEMILALQDWWKYVKAKWKTILIWGAVGCVLGLTYSLITPAKYVARTNFVLENVKSGNRLMSLAAKFGMGSNNEDGLFGDEDNIIIFLKSRTMVSQTLLSTYKKSDDSELLINRYLKVYGFTKKWKGTRLGHLKFKPFYLPNNRLEDSVVSLIHNIILNNNLKVEKPDKDGNIVNVTTTTTDELLSKSFTDNLIENATEFYTKVKTKKTYKNVLILQHQVDSVKSLLTSDISGMALGTDAIPNINPAYQRLKVPTQLKSVDVQMNKAILEQLVANLELSKLELRKESPLVQVIDEPVLPLERHKVGKLKGIILGFILLSFIAVLVQTIKHYIQLSMSK